MPTVEDIADEIIDREGGYVDDPDDPGGATNFGITIHTMRALGHDTDRDGKITSADVRCLSRDQARAILVEHYFRRPRLSLLPEAIQATVFDMQVNSGSQAVRLLQQLLCEMGEPVAVDGVIGPQTAAAAHRAGAAGPDLADAYGIARRNYYYSLGDRRPASRKYCRRRDGGKGGWITRAERFIAPSHHLTEDQHRDRCQPWV